MSSQYLDDRQIGPTTDVYQRLEDVRRAIDNRTLELANQDREIITYIVSGGDSRRYDFTLHLRDEGALAEGSKNGGLECIMAMAYKAVRESLELAPRAKVKFCFNSDEYVHESGDGFARWHNGDWRKDYAFVLNSEGNILNAPN